MDDINRSISQYVKDGKYYEDARLWYVNKFIIPISEKSYLIILVAFYMFVMAIAGYYYSNTNPAAPEVTYLLFSDDITKTYSVIHSTGDDGQDPQMRLTQYLVERYVENRESYDIKNIATQLEHVRNTTVGTEYLKFENMMSINNPVGPMMIYQDLYQKSVKIHKVNVLNISSKIKKAIVYFQSNLKNIATNQIIFEDYVATIDFKIDTITNLIKENANTMQFLVMDYNLRKVNIK